jgi:hypothetical protein
MLLVWIHFYFQSAYFLLNLLSNSFSLLCVLFFYCAKAKKNLGIIWWVQEVLFHLFIKSWVVSLIRSFNHCSEKTLVCNWLIIVLMSRVSFLNYFNDLLVKEKCNKIKLVLKVDYLLLHQLLVLNINNLDVLLVNVEKDSKLNHGVYALNFQLLQILFSVHIQGVLKHSL